MVIESIKRGARQVVLAGSGYDTRPLRLAATGVCFYEVDAPDTLSMKAERLQALDTKVFMARQHPVLVSVDMQSRIETGKIGFALRQRGFRADLPSVIVMEEVTQYIPKSCFVEVLNFAASLHHVIVVLTYIQTKALIKPEKICEDVDVRKLLVEDIGQITSGYNPREMGNFMSQFGLYLENDIGSDEIRQLLRIRNVSRRRSFMRLEYVCFASRGSLRHKSTVI